MTRTPKVPASSRNGSIDSRSSDAGESQADEVKSRAERARKTKQHARHQITPREGEVQGALQDQTAR